ncbi:site-2 protease family protein [Candidatus Saccharibacteria bacterium]|nr:site-2 protease family protein [Candidatus Saccharibacteria bacterium]
MSVVLGILVGLLMLVFLVTAHEFGHFLMARRNGVEVEEFGICFPPRAIAWRKVDGKWRRLKKSEWNDAPGEGTILSLNWLPIGGFCQMKGESDADTKKGSFGRATYLRKTKILFGGVLANWLIAFVILTIMAWVGMPHFIENQFQVNGDTAVISLKNVTISEIKENSPAQFAGLRVDDEIVSLRRVEGQEITFVRDVDTLLAFDKAHAGEEILITYKRKEKMTTTRVKLNDANAEYVLGAGITGEAVYKSTWSAPVVGLGLTFQLTGETFKGIGQLFVNLFSGLVKTIIPNDEVRRSGAEELKSAGDSVSGPIGIVGVLFPAVLQNGGRSLFFFVALISVSLACMNVLPIPALDGGRWLMITIARLRKKRLAKETEEKIVSRSFIVILAIAVIVTILDVMRIFK